MSDNHPGDKQTTAHVRIEMDRGNGWEMRADGEAQITADELRTQLPAYAVQYPHRAFLNGEIIGEVQPKKRNARS